MLSQQNRLKNKKDFDRVFKYGKSSKNDFLLLKFKNNNLEDSRFGIVVGKKVSKKAVVRNKIKRRLTEIIKKKLDKIKRGIDVVLITNPGLEKEKFKNLEEKIENIFKKANIIC